jgi:hypothetical protein
MIYLLSSPVYLIPSDQILKKWMKAWLVRMNESMTIFNLMFKLSGNPQRDINEWMKAWLVRSEVKMWNAKMEADFVNLKIDNKW